MKPSQFGQPIIAIVNSFTQFVPGHVHLHDAGQQIKQIIEAEGCFAAEFNTIAIDDGIAMGHSGMLYSLPSRDLIADSVEYMCRAHRVDALICISNCDKITPGMMMAALRLNLPAVFVSGGPMEAGRVKGKDTDLIDIMVQGANPACSQEDLDDLEQHGCPGCGCCSGMFTANSMNCLAEAIGLAPAGNGTVLATHPLRRELFARAARLIVRNARAYYFDNRTEVLPRSIACKNAFLNVMTLDIAMGGSSNTVLHLLALAHEAGVDFTMKEIDNLSRRIPVLCKVAPSSPYHMQDVSRAGGVLGILDQLDQDHLLHTETPRVDYPTLKDALEDYPHLTALYLNAPGQATYPQMDTDRATGCLRDRAHAYNNEGGLAVLYGNLAPDGCIVKTAGVDPALYTFDGKAILYNSQEEAVEGILSGEVQKGHVVVIRYEGPKGGPGMQEMLYPTSYLKSRHIDKECALLTDGRFSGGTSGLSIGHISPEAAAGGPLARLQNGDPIHIDIPNRLIEVQVPQDQFDSRQPAPLQRNRIIPQSLRLYAQNVSSADKGAVRIL